MKVIKLLATLLLAATTTSLIADESVKTPFESVRLIDGKIEAVLPPSGSHWVAITGGGIKPATQHEKFSLANGEELQLVERHIHYQFVAVVSANKNGLEVKYKFSAEFTGKESVVKNYFIAAK